jgi:hypothetical protein
MEGLVADNALHLKESQGDLSLFSLKGKQPKKVSVESSDTTPQITFLKVLPDLAQFIFKC